MARNPQGLARPRRTVARRTAPVARPARVQRFARTASRKPKGAHGMGPRERVRTLHAFAAQAPQRRKAVPRMVPLERPARVQAFERTASRKRKRAPGMDPRAQPIGLRWRRDKRPLRPAREARMVSPQVYDQRKTVERAPLPQNGERCRGSRRLRTTRRPLCLCRTAARWPRQAVFPRGADQPAWSSPGELNRIRWQGA
jgi:hypothetical protein